MQYGFVVPGGDIQTNGDFAAEAEAAGWDGIFVADAIAIATESGPFPFYDPWIILAVMAMRTERIRLGPIITAGAPPPPREQEREAPPPQHPAQPPRLVAASLVPVHSDH